MRTKTGYNFVYVLSKPKISDKSILKLRKPDKLDGPKIFMSLSKAFLGYP